MKKKALSLLVGIIALLLACANTRGNTADPKTLPVGIYLGFGQIVPGSTPQKFAPGVISVPGTTERSLSLSPNGDELFFARTTGFPNTKIMTMKRKDDGWTQPEPAAFLKDDFATQAVFSPDGQYLYFSSSRGKSDIEHYSLWRAKKVGNGWSEPENIIDPDTTGKAFIELHPTVSQDYSIYFMSWDMNRQIGDIYVSRQVDGAYAAPVMLGPPISTQYNELRPTISPDGKYLLFESDRPGGLGGSDIYITFNRSDGSWSAPKNLGSTVNTASEDEVPNISPDGKYWFFMKNGDIYWREAPVLPNPE